MRQSGIVDVGSPTPTIFTFFRVDVDFSGIEHVDLSRENDRIRPKENNATAKGVLGNRVGLVSLTIGGWTVSRCQAVR